MLNKTIIIVVSLSSVLLSIAHCQGQDLTTQAGSNGSAVVSACISRIQQSEIFTSDNEMLRRIAYVETSNGNDADTYRLGYHGGIWAVDEALLDMTQNISFNSTLINLHQQIESKFSIQWSSVEWNDLRKPLYSALAARLYFYTVSASVPISSNIQSQASYWVTYYNPFGSVFNFVTLVNQLVAQNQCSVSGIDIYFILEESGSVGSSNYQLMKQFVYDTVNEFDIGPDDTQVGVVSYSNSARVQFYLNNYHDKATLLAAINSLPFYGGGTNTAAPIDLLHTDGFTSTSGARSQSQAIPQVAVVITANQSTNHTATATSAENAQNEGIILFSVGVGNNVNTNELEDIASDPSYVYTLTGFDTSQFNALQTTIVNEACTTPFSMQINETIDTSIGEGEQTFIEIPYEPNEGVTIKVNVTNGTVVVYASDQIKTHNEAFYDWMIETDGYSEVFLDPNDVNRTLGDTVYIAVEGEDTDNDFTFTPENGDTSTTVPTPQNVTIDSVTATTVTVSWTPPTIDNIIQYNIELSEEEFGLSTVRASTTGTSVTVTGLEEYNTYGCKVASVSSVGAGPFSSPVNFTTLEAAPAAAPQSPSGSAQSPSVITLEWNPPPEIDINGEIEYYVVEVMEVYTGRMWTFHAVDIHINVGSLHAYYVYKCRVAAFTIGQGPFTNYYNVYSGEKAPTAAPENVTVVDDSPSSVELTWDAPPYEMQNGHIRHYNVKITTVETGQVLEVTSNYTNVTVNGLLPFYNYTCIVSAETVADGPSSDEITFVLPEGPPDGAPENVTGSATSSTSIRLTWDTPARNLQNGYIVEYRVRVTEKNTGRASTSTVTDRSLTLTSLHPYYIYLFSVAAVTVGIGPYSIAINITTDEDVPTGPPQNFTALPSSPFTADLSWSPPLDDEQNGVIINYAINITEDDTGYEFQLSTSNSAITVDYNLKPYYTYTCVIGAGTSVGLGPFSSSIDFRTHEYIPSEPQLNLSRSVGEPNNLLATWTVPEDPNGIIQNYTVYCDATVLVEGSGVSGAGDLLLDISESNTPTVIVVVPGSDLSVVVMELTPYTYYDCYVTANTSVGEGNSSMVQSAQTDESEPGDAPTNFNLVIINSTAIRLTWNEPLLPYGVLLSYTVIYNTSNGNISRVVNSTEPRNIIIAELQEHTWYRFVIVASTRVGDGPYTYLTARTDISEPHAPPSNITFEVDSSTQTTMLWHPPPFQYQNGPILYYNLIVSDLVFGLDDIDIIVTSLSYTITGLEEYNNYSVIIAASTVVGIGPYSNPVIFTTQQDIPSAPPTSVTGDVQSSTVVVFTWLDPPSIDQNGIIQYYLVKVHEIETGILWTFFAVDEHISIGSLHPYYYYDCTVAAHTTVGTGPYSAAIRVQTEEAAPSGPPLQLMSLKTSNSLILLWDPPLNESQNGIIQQYVIQILEDDTSTTTTYYSNNTLLTVNNLHPYYTYKCSVAAITVGVGPYSVILAVQLDEDSPTAAPINRNGSSPSSTSIRLSWNPPPFEYRNGIIRSYIINSIELETNISSTYTSLETTLTINSLHPYYRYQFTIAAVTISSGPPTAAFTIRTQEDAPSSPAQNTSVDSTTATSISLSWEPPEDDQKNGIIWRYVIRVVPVNGGTPIYLNSTETSATVTSLSPYTLYDCSIAAETSVGRGPFSSAITVRTEEAAPSAPPQNLTGTSVNSQTISLSWSPPPLSDTNGIIREYRVNVTEVETGVRFFLTTATTSITLQSLHPYYNYCCIVSAYTVEVGPYTAVFNVKTPEDVPSGYPQSFSVQSTSSRSALLTWNSPNTTDQNGIIIEYTINVSAVETGEEFQLTSTTTSYNVTHLRPYTTYQCIIAASTSVGIGPFSTIVTILTPEDVPTSAPQDPNGYAVSSNSIFLSWDPPPVLERHGIIREYHINLTEQETETLTTYTSMDTSIEIAQLHPFYNYRWIVTAVTIGEGPYTASDAVMTLEDVPSGAPLNFYATEITSTSFDLVWELPAPSERNGIITGYNISVTSLNSPLEDPQYFFTTSQSITVDSLDPHTDYICIIAANTAIGTGPFSFEMNVQTDQDVPSDSPSNTTGVALNSTHVYLSWDPPPPDEINGVIQGYRINITELDTGDMLQHTAEDSNATIGSLHPHYTYNFTIAAFTLIGNGPTTYVVIRTAEAAPSSAPTAFEATASNPTSIFLSWNPPPMEDQNGIIRHYEVTLITLESGEIHIRTSTALFITVVSLQPYTTYNCTVAAETVATGPTTTGMLVQTLQAAPTAPPDDVQVTAGDSRTLQLSWQPPSNSSRNGIIQHYIINITELETNSSFQLETTDLFVVVDDLHPYYQYSCSVAAETVGLGPFSIAVIIQLPEDAPSSPPMGVSISMITSTSFYLSWNDLPPVHQNGLIRYYLVNITELDTGTVFTYTTTTTDFTAQFLHPYYYYMCSVSAVTISPGPYSDFQIIQTEIDVPSGPPESTDSLAISSTSLVLMWYPPLMEHQNGPIEGYSVRVTRVDNSDIFEWDTNSTIMTVDSLVPYTLYEWRVAAQTIAGAGPFSSPVTEQTFPDAPDDAPQDLEPINVESRIIELIWSPPPADTHNGEIVHYTIDYTEVQTGMTSVTMSFNTTVTIGNLHPFYEYNITVTAFTVDFGPPSTSITIQTLEDGCMDGSAKSVETRKHPCSKTGNDAPSAPPTNISATAVSARTLNITWQPPELAEQNGIIRSYILTLSVTETGSSELLMSDQPQLMLEDLHPFYLYSFLIAAVTISPGPYSEIVSIQMPQAAPISSPQNVSVNVISSEEISVTWEPPLEDNQNGIITSYTIRLYDIVADKTTLYQREGHHAQFVIDTLHPYYEYDVSVAAETVDIGPFSVIQRIRTQEDIPSDAPQNLTVVATESRSLLLTWLPPPPDTQNGVIRQYIIFISVRETRESFVLFSNDEPYMFNLAHPYYTYTISVAAETIGTGPHGADFTIRTPEDVPTGTPQLVEAVAVSSSSIRITWIPPPEEEQNGVIRSYFINVTELQTGSVREFEAYGDESIQIVNQLHPFYTYECAIAAFTVGLGPAAFMQTMTYPAVPSFVPLDVVAEPLNATHALLLWDPPPPEHQNGVIEQYHITIKVTETGEVLQHFSTHNSTVIGQLHPFYTYMFSVAAQTVAVGPYSSQISLKMPEAAPSGVVGNLSVEIQSASSVIVSWLPPDIQFWNGIVTSYIVIYENLGLVGGNTDDKGSGLQLFRIQSVTISGFQLANIQDPGVVPLPLRSESVLIEQLEEYHIYSFAVQQANAEGISLFSGAVLQEMPETAPAGSPVNVVIEVLSSTSVIIKWEPPELLLRNGIITKYNLRVTLNSNNTVQRYAVPATVLSVPIEGMQKYSIVSVQIAAETAVGIGPFSDPVSALTDQDIPPTPKNPESKVLNETAVSLVWYTPDSPNGIILEYQVIYYGYKPLSDKRKTQESDIEILDGPKIINVTAKKEENPIYNLTINDLVPGLAYTIKLRARTNVGYGENFTLTSTQPASGAKDSSQSSSPSKGATVVIVLVIFAVIGWILVILFGVYFVKRRQSSHKDIYDISRNASANEMGVWNPQFEEQDKAENHYESDNKASMPESNVEKYVTDERTPPVVEEPQPEQITKL